MTTTANPAIASTIISQLPRGAFAMMGAKDLVDLGNGLRFRVRGAAPVTHVQIVLDPSDTYTVTTYQIKRHGLDVRDLSTVPMVYADNLRHVIETATGLYLSL